MIYYVAHPVGPDGPERVANIARVKEWVRWLIHARRGDAFSVPWLPYVEVLTESPDHRERGMRDGMEMLRRCDAIVLVGGRLSPGMAAELREAKHRKMAELDLLYLGRDAPPIVAP